MNKLKEIPLKDIKKFYNILNKMGRMCEDFYPQKKCQKQIFVSRVSKLLPKGWIILNEEKDTPYKNVNSSYKIIPKIRKNRIIYFNGISFNLDWKMDNLIIFGEKFSYNDILNLQYRFLTKEEELMYLSLINQDYKKVDCYILKKTETKYNTKNKVKTFLKKYFDIIDTSKVDIIWASLKCIGRASFIISKDSDRFSLGETIFLGNENLTRNPIFNIIKEENLRTLESELLKKKI